MATHLCSPVILTQSSCCQGNLVPDIRRPLQETKQLLTNNSYTGYLLGMGKKSVHPLTLTRSKIKCRQQYNPYHTESCFSMAKSNRYVGLRVGMCLKKGENSKGKAWSSFIIFTLKFITVIIPICFHNKTSLLPQVFKYIWSLRKTHHGLSCDYTKLNLRSSGHVWSGFLFPWLLKMHWAGSLTA